MKFLSILLIGLVLSACDLSNPWLGFHESSFELHPSSRLPVWVVAPVDRRNIKIELHYFTSPFDGDDTLLTLKDIDGNILLEVTGVSEYHPEYWEWAQRDRVARRYPIFMNVTIEGKTEVIEHKKMEPAFYMSDYSNVIEVISDGG
jgi:hypothetical protein